MQMRVHNGGNDDFAAQALMAVAGGVPHPYNVMASRIPMMPSFANTIHGEVAGRPALVASGGGPPSPTTGRDEQRSFLDVLDNVQRAVFMPDVTNPFNQPEGEIGLHHLADAHTVMVGSAALIAQERIELQEEAQHSSWR